MNEESEENDEENTKLVESLEVGFTVNVETNPALDVFLQKQREFVTRQLEETAAKNEGIRTLTDKEIADYLRENGEHILDKIYRALYNNGGPINSSEITPPPLPLKFMTRALTADIELIIINWSGGSDEGHLDVNFKDKAGEALSSWTEHRPFIRALFADIEEWCYDTMDYGGAGDGSSYGDIIRYNLKEGTVSTETWWTEEVHGGEGFDTMETC
jgi:hypothetical protein